MLSLPLWLLLLNATALVKNNQRIVPVLQCCFMNCFGFFPVSPAKPEEMDWSELYPEFFPPLTKDSRHDDPKDAEERAKPAFQVEFADIGCGYGGLLGNLFSLPLMVFSCFCKQFLECRNVDIGLPLSLSFLFYPKAKRK